MATSQVVTTTNGSTQTKPTVLDNIHSELQAKLKAVDNVKDLLPFIEKTLLLESLKIQISSFLAERLKIENKQQDASDSIIQSLSDELKEKEQMKPRQIDDDEDTKNIENGNVGTNNANNVGPQQQNSQNGNFRRQRPPRRQQYGGPPAWSTSICYNCNESGHYSRECPLNRNNGNGGRGGFGGYGPRGSNRRRSRNNQNMKCYHCGNDGHIAKDCPGM